MPSISGHSGSVYSLDVSVEEDLLVTGAGDSDPSVRVWSLPDGTFLREDLHEGRVHDIAFSPSSSAARYPITCIAGTQLTAWLWEVERGDYWPEARRPRMIRAGGVASGQEQRARVRTQPSGVPHGDRGSRQAPGASHADGGR